jgi:hypothetical protein
MGEQEKMSVDDCKQKVSEMKKNLREESRVIELMRAGLKERPLDRDFFDKKLVEYEQHKNMTETAQMLVGFMEKAAQEE